jgi:hypothetical protein
LTAEIYIDANPVHAIAGLARNARTSLSEIFEATEWPVLDGIRGPATEMLIGLQELELPALVTLEIVDALFPNSIPMHKKWNLVVAVKHFKREL